MSYPTELGAFRSTALRHYGQEVAAEDLSEISQTEFDAMHRRAREAWEKAEAVRIAQKWGVQA